jgi:hypothetical protein
VLDRREERADFPVDPGSDEFVELKLVYQTLQWADIDARGNRREELRSCLTELYPLDPMGTQLIRRVLAPAGVRGIV